MCPGEMAITVDVARKGSSRARAIGRHIFGIIDMGAEQAVTVDVCPLPLDLSLQLGF